MNRVLARLEAVAAAWSVTPGAVALLACGSCGQETHRLDAYSDLDFFAVVQPSSKPARVGDLAWLEAAAPVAYRFQNFDDAWQVLFADGLYAEFGVVTEEDLKRITYSPARVVWARPEFDTTLCQPRTAPPADTASDRWLIGQALSLLLVGLGRFCRGERLSAWKDVQVRAFDYVLRLLDRQTAANLASRDAFSAERRFELRHPSSAAQLPHVLAGYDQTCESALAQLALLEEWGGINAAMATEVRRLAALGRSQSPSKIPST